MLRELKRDHKITYLTLDDGAADAGRAPAVLIEYCDELVCVPHHAREKFYGRILRELLFNLASPMPYAVKKYYSAQCARNRERARAGKFDSVVCDFLAPAANVPFDLECPPFSSNITSRR
jgi:hypothetical protein